MWGWSHEGRISDTEEVDKKGLLHYASNKKIHHLPLHPVQNATQLSPPTPPPQTKKKSHQARRREGEKKRI